MNYFLVDLILFSTPDFLVIRYFSRMLDLSFLMLRMIKEPDVLSFILKLRWPWKLAQLVISVK